MPDRPTASLRTASPGARESVSRGRWAAVLTLVLTLLLPVGSVFGSPAVAQAEAIGIFQASDVIGDVDVDAVVADLQQDRLAGVSPGSSDYAGLVSQIERSDSSNIDLHVVILGKEITGAEPSEVTAAVLAAVGGTVILLTPERIEVASQTVSQTDLDEARAAAQSGGGEVGVVTAFVDSITATGFPWSLVVILLVVVLLVAAVAGGLWEKRRRQKRNEEALARLTRELHDSVGALAPDILYISERISLVEDKKLSERFNEASSSYNEFRDRLAAGPLKSREEVDHVDIAVSKLRAELAAIRAAVDAGISA